jgi:macrodomain Ter protein organizer (MatP/YcbG family)
VTRGGKRKGAGRPSAFPHGTVLHRRSVRLPAEVWTRLDALAKEWATTDDGAIARLLDEHDASREPPRVT